MSILYKLQYNYSGMNQLQENQHYLRTHDPKEVSNLFLGDAFHWLTRTTTTKDTTEIKQWVKPLKQRKTQQQETLVHVISILNITGYATQLNRQKINEMMDAL